MNHSSEDIARQLRLGEDSGWEFKQIEFSGNRPTSPRRDDLADEIAAFANGDGGVLLCGVTDQGVVQGMSRPQIDTELTRPDSAAVPVAVVPPDGAAPKVTVGAEV